MIEAGELSIFTAAAQAPDQLAILTRDRALTFADAAALVGTASSAPPLQGQSATPPGPSLGFSLASSIGPATATDLPVSAHPLLAERTVATIIAIYAALERREPLGLIHPQQSASIRDLGREALRRHRVPIDTAVVLFTSGTTARPRGVVLSRRALIAAAHAHAGRIPWRRDDRWLVALPLAHAGGLAAVVRCLVARRPVVVLEETAGQAPWPLAVALASSAATLTSLVPAQLSSLLGDESWRPPSALRAVLVGGASCPPSLRRRARDRGVPVRVSYGMTETFGQVATAEAPSDDDTAIGPPLPGVVLRAGTADAPAVIEVRGAMCMTGYLGEPPLLDPHVVSNDDGWIDADGTLHVVGRRDDVIITGGYKVAPLHVEELLRGHGDVLDACVFAVPDPRWGQVIAAVLVVAATFSLDHATLRWAGSLPPQQRPRQISIAEHLPLGANGKVDRIAAAALPRQPVIYPISSKS
jgi:o-succinylbenzoate---CoA ligase